MIQNPDNFRKHSSQKSYVKFSFSQERLTNVKKNICYIDVFYLISSSRAFPFLFATNLFSQYQLNCFPSSVQKHRSAEGILDIGGEERETAKHNICRKSKVFKRYT